MLKTFSTLLLIFSLVLPTLPLSAYGSAIAKAPKPSSTLTEQALVARLYGAFRPGGNKVAAQQTHAVPALEPVEALVDDLLPVLFDLNYLDPHNVKSTAAALYDLLKYTHHKYYRLDRYIANKGRYAKLLQEVYIAYQHLPQAELISSLPMEDIVIVPHAPLNPLRHSLPWEALVYVDGRVIVIHEAFLKFAVSVAADHEELVSVLSHVLGHENTHRKTSDQPRGDHKKALRLFPLSQIASEALYERWVSEYRDEHLVSKGKVWFRIFSMPSPKQELPSEIDQAVALSYQRLNQRQESADDAGRRIVESIRDARVSAQFETLETAIPILMQSKKPEWTYLLAEMLKQQQVPERSLEAFFIDAQLALQRGESKAIRYHVLQRAFRPYTALNSLWLPFLLYGAAQWLASDSSPITGMALLIALPSRSFPHHLGHSA